MTTMPSPSFKKSKTRARGAVASETSWAWPNDWGGQQMVVAAEEAQILISGWNTMRQIQEQAVREGIGRHAAAAQRLRGMQRGEDLLALQAELLRQDMEGAARYLQQLTETALEMSAELFGCANHLINTEDAFGTTSRLFHA
jgi:hypothetical protein